MSGTPVVLSRIAARRAWMQAQRLNERTPFGAGPDATRAAVEHLGYVQIDTINVIERAHHHILYSRIPDYRRTDLNHAQSRDKSVFEYWAHALAYIPVRDVAHFVGQMKAHRKGSVPWYGHVTNTEMARIIRRIRDDGPISIRDVEDDVLVEKNHLWASRKPSKAALQRAFFEGRLAISGREGMLKTYELMERHFGWSRLPPAATARQTAEYLLDRALRSQGLIDAASVMYPKLRYSPQIARLVDSRLKRGMLVPVDVEGGAFLAEPDALAATHPDPELVHILSPFDPLIIQRKRLKRVFGYDHLFEAYVPKAKRKLGYFALPVLLGDRIVAALDLKADRAAGKLLIQAWHWLPHGRARTHKRLIEAELDRFSRFQFGD